MKKLITLMSLAVVGLTFGQEEEPKFNVTGSVDAYFHTSLNGPNDVPAGLVGDYFSSAPSGIMGNDDRGFSGANANVKFSYEGEKVGFIADLAYGPRADAQFSDFDVVNEAYMYWNASEKVTLMMGRWNSWMGYENFAAADNFHYSYSHQYTFGPRNMNGIAAQFSLGNDFNFGIGVMNPLETTEGNTSGDYSIAAGISKGDTGISFASSQERTYIDFKTAVNLGNINVKLNVHNADFGDEGFALGESFTSISAYPQIKSSDNLSWGLRLEYMMIKDSIVGDDLNVFTPTLTANYSVGDLTIIPELRLDSASEDIFTDNDNDAVGGKTAFMLAAVYSF